MKNEETVLMSGMQTLQGQEDEIANSRSQIANLPEDAGQEMADGKLQMAERKNGKADVLIKLNTDFSIQGMSSQDLQAIVAAWQAGALSKDTMFELFRRGEILPDGRTNQDEAALTNASSSSSPALP